MSSKPGKWYPTQADLARRVAELEARCADLTEQLRLATIHAAAEEADANDLRDHASALKAREQVWREYVRWLDGYRDAYQRVEIALGLLSRMQSSSDAQFRKRLGLVEK